MQHTALQFARQRGTMEFTWFETEEPPPLLTILERQHRADEAFEATWADQPSMRYKVLAVSREFTSELGILTAKVELVAEAEG